MTRAKIEIRVGLTVLGAVLVLTIGLMWLTNFSFEETHYTVQVRFPHIGMLETGDQVSVFGIKRGKVQELQLDGNRVLATLELANDVKLKQDAQFTVKNLGLMGECYVDVQPGESDEPLDISQRVEGRYDEGLTELTSVLGPMVDEMSELAKALRASVASDTSLSGMVKTIQNAQDISRELKATVEENRPQLSSALEDFSAAARSLREIAATSEEQIEQVVDRMDTTSAALTQFVSQLDTMSTQVNTLLERVDRGEGTLGLLVHDDELYNQLKTASQNLETLIADIRANPQKYVQVQIKLF